MLGTTGTFETGYKSKTTLEKSPLHDAAKATKVSPKIKLDVNVENKGLSFGGEYYLNGLQPLMPVNISDYYNEGLSLETIKNASEGNIWAKYVLPETKGVKSYVKLDFTHKPSEGISKTLIVEGNISYDYNGFTFGLNSKTFVPYKDFVKSAHKLYLESEKASVISDLKASVEVSHYYIKLNRFGKATTEKIDIITTEDLKFTAFDRVKFNLEGSYKEIKDLTIEGKGYVEYSEKGAEFETVYKKVWDYNNPKIENIKVLFQHYELSSEYKGVKNLTLTAKGEVKYLLGIYSNVLDHKLECGLDLKAEYKPIENLTLLANGLFYLNYDAVFPKLSGFVYLGASSKYDYKINDKFVVSPKLGIAYYITGMPYGIKEILLTPEISAEYKILDNLTLTGDISAKVNFKNTFEYKNTTFKTGVNLKYAW